MYNQRVYRSDRHGECVRFRTRREVDEDSIYGTRSEEHRAKTQYPHNFFLIIYASALLDPGELVPLALASLIKQTLWNPRKEVCRIRCLLLFG